MASPRFSNNPLYIWKLHASFICALLQIFFYIVAPTRKNSWVCPYLLTSSLLFFWTGLLYAFQVNASTWTKLDPRLTQLGLLLLCHLRSTKESEPDFFSKPSTLALSGSSDHWWQWFRALATMTNHRRRLFSSGDRSWQSTESQQTRTIRSGRLQLFWTRFSSFPIRDLILCNSLGSKNPDPLMHCDGLTAHNGLLYYAPLQIRSYWSQILFFSGNSEPKNQRPERIYAGVEEDWRSMKELGFSSSGGKR